GAARALDAAGEGGAGRRSLAAAVPQGGGRTATSPTIPPAAGDGGLRASHQSRSSAWTGRLGGPGAALGLVAPAGRHRQPHRSATLRASAPGDLAGGVQGGGARWAGPMAHAPPGGGESSRGG